MSGEWTNIDTYHSLSVAKQTENNIYKTSPTRHDASYFFPKGRYRMRVVIRLTVYKTPVRSLLEHGSSICFPFTYIVKETLGEIYNKYHSVFFSFKVVAPLRKI